MKSIHRYIHILYFSPYNNSIGRGDNILIIIIDGYIIRGIELDTLDKSIKQHLTDIHFS